MTQTTQVGWSTVVFGTVYWILCVLFCEQVLPCITYTVIYVNECPHNEARKLSIKIIFYLAHGVKNPEIGSRNATICIYRGNTWTSWNIRHVYKTRCKDPIGHTAITRFAGGYDWQERVLKLLCSSIPWHNYLQINMHEILPHQLFASNILVKMCVCETFITPMPPSL